MVATSQREAREILRDRPDVTHSTMHGANRHLAEVKAPPTDPHYANQYRVYKVNRPAEPPITPQSDRRAEYLREVGRIEAE